MSSAGARVIAHGSDISKARDPEYKAYEARNLRLGEFAGLMRTRVRYRGVATDWFDYLYCSPDELAGLLVTRVGSRRSTMRTRRTTWLSSPERDRS